MFCQLVAGLLPGDIQLLRPVERPLEDGFRLPDIGVFQQGQGVVNAAAENGVHPAQDINIIHT